MITGTIVLVLSVAAFFMIKGQSLTIVGFCVAFALGLALAASDPGQITLGVMNDVTAAAVGAISNAS